MKIKILLFFIVISSNIFAQSNLLKEGVISQKNYFIALDFTIYKGKIIIPVEIAGKEYRFLFDTGAPNMLNSNIFKLSNKIGNLKISDSNKNQQNLMIVNVPLFRISSIEFKNFNFLEYDISKNFAFNCLNIDGIIGSNSFRNSIIKIDYLNKKIYITDKIQNLSPKVKGKKMKLVGEQNAPYLEITLAGKKKVYEDVLFDTGFNNFYVQSNRAFNIFKNENILENVITKKAMLAVSLFGSDNISEKSIFTIPTLNLSSVDFINITAYTSDDNNSKFGTDLLNYGNITLDFQKSKYYFESTQQKIDLKKNYPLFAPSFYNGKFIVGMVINNELENKINVGDEIISIDEKKTDIVDCDNILNFSYPKEKFKVKNATMETEINIKNYR